MKITQKVEKIVEREARSKNNYYGYNAYKFHIKNVVRFARIIAKKKNIDTELAELAAFLHDFASLKNIIKIIIFMVLAKPKRY